MDNQLTVLRETNQMLAQQNTKLWEQNLELKRIADALEKISNKN